MPAKPRPDERPGVTVAWELDEGLEKTVDLGFLEAVLGEALSRRELAGPLEVGLTITTDEGIRDLNRLHRQVDAATDVLSFPMLEFEHPEKAKTAFPLPPGESLFLGDIVVSYPRALEQAGTYGHSSERELAFLVVHGAMHLLGYDHDDPSDQQKMREEEEAVLKRLNLTR